MKYKLTFFLWLPLATSLYGQQEEYNRAIANDDREAIVKYGEIMVTKGYQSASLFRKLAAAYKEKCSLNQCIAYLNKAFTLDTNDVRTSISLGEAYYANGEEDKALAYLYRVSNVDTTNTYAISLQLKIFISKGTLPSAQIRAAKLCMLDSTNYINFRNLGLIQLKQGAKNDAQASFERAVRLNANDHLSRIKLCNLLIVSSKNQQAARIAKDGIALISDPKSQSAIVLKRNLALIQYNQIHADSCLNYIKELRADGDTLEVFTYKLAGFCYFMKQSYADAAANLEVVYRKSPDGDSLQFQLPFTIAQSYFYLYEMKMAKKYLDIAIRNITPLPEQVYNSTLLNGLYQRRVEDYPAAISAFEDAIKVKPLGTEAYYALKDTYYIDLKNSTKAFDTLKRYVLYVDKLKESGVEIEANALKSYESMKRDILQKH